MFVCIVSHARQSSGTFSTMFYVDDDDDVDDDEQHSVVQSGSDAYAGTFFRDFSGAKTYYEFWEALVCPGSGRGCQWSRQ